MNDNNRLQKRLLDMMKFFHEYCESKNLSYIALGGTMLGAARHRGFIPWDDDIDVGMPREDFDKLMEHQGEFLGNFYLEGPESKDKGFCFPYGKLYDTKSTLIENTRYQLVRGVFIDIFPLDGLTNEAGEIEKAYKGIKKYRDRLLIRTLALSRRRKWYKNCLIFFARMIPFKRFNEKEICHRLDERFKTKGFSTYRYGGNMFGAWGIKEIMETDIVGTPQLYDFEDMKIYGAEQYDAYLSHLYGDWKKLPPEEKRVTHHDYYLDLDTSYLDYKREK